MTQQNCTQCSQTFTIYSEDREFYSHFDVPDPTMCPDCRSQQRMAHRNEVNLYPGTCALCNKPIISQYSADKQLTVYCRECWWSDAWDPYSYGRAYDFSRPFFEQFNEFIRSVPLINLLDYKSENSEYTHCVSNNKNCYLIFSSDYNENCLYSVWLSKCKEVVDCFRVANSEQSYASFFCDRLYNCQYMVKCFSATESMYCYDSRNIQNCALSYNLRNKQYYIFNEQYTKTDYEKKLAELQLDTVRGRAKALEKFNKLMNNDAIHHYRNTLGRIENVSGDYLRNAHNIFHCYDLEEATNCRYVRNMNFMKDSMDCEYGGDGENGYQNVETYPMPQGGMCTFACYGGSAVLYSHSIMNSKDVFASSGLKKAQYVIFNKQYSQVEHEAMLMKIKAHMKQTGEWGEFFPIQHSLFGYNETNAQDWMPMTQQQVSQQQWSWHEFSLPAEAQGDAHTCTQCKSPFKLVQAELDFYAHHKIPEPTKCYKCRYADRRAWHTPMQLRNIQCTCTRAEHDNHAAEQRCSETFETTYPEDFARNIFCSDCYRAEIY